MDPLDTAEMKIDQVDEEISDDKAMESVADWIDSPTVVLESKEKYLKF